LFAFSDTIFTEVDSVIIDSLMFGETYFWRTKAIGNKDTSDWCPAFRFSIIDYPIQILPVDSAEYLFPNTLFSWNFIENVVSYIVEYDNDNLFSNPTQIISEDTLVNASNLLFGETYYWRVKVVSDNDTSDYSDVRVFSVIDTLNLVYPLDGASVDLSVTLKWDTIGGVTYYECYVDTNNLFSSSLFESIIVEADLPIPQAFTVLPLFNAYYYWKVRAINQNDTSDWSDIRTFNTTNNIELALPYNGAIDIMPHVSLFTYYSSGILDYQFQLDTANTFDSYIYDTRLVQADVPFVELNNEELLFGTKYYWRARGRQGSNATNWTSIWNFTTIDKLTQLSPEDGDTITNTSPILEWNKIGGITHYVFEYDTSNLFLNATQDTVYSKNKSISISTNLLLPNNTYYWRVKAAHLSDSSSWSDVWSFYYSSNVGIEEITSSENQVLVYPNPSDGNVNVEIYSSNSNSVGLEVYDISGRLVYSESLYLYSGVNNKNIDLTTLTKGVYVMKIQGVNDNAIVNKLIIK
jgi:hypothetical protein